MTLLIHNGDQEHPPMGLRDRAGLALAERIAATNYNAGRARLAFTALELPHEPVLTTL
jgi:hypothetical protein